MKASVYILYRLLWGFLAILPLPFCHALGRLLGALACFLLGRYRRLAIENITAAFDGEPSAPDPRRIAAEHFRRLGANWLCAPRLSVLPPKALRKVIHTPPSAAARLAEARDRGRGIVAVLAHLGNWEAAAQAMPSLVPPPIGAVYQRIGNPLIDAHIRKTRERRGLKLLERRSGLAAALRILREGGGIGILADQHAGASGVWAPFFGRLTSTTPLPGLLARRTGAALVLLNVRTAGRARWRLEVSGPFEPSADPGATAAIINQLIETEIRKDPADWFWVHDRWKVPRSDFLLSRSRRGVALPPGRSAADLKPFNIIIRSPNWLGDAVMSAPAVAAIKTGRPDARVTVVTPGKLQDVWRRVPAVDAVIPLPPKASVAKAARLIRAAGRADAAVLFPNSLRSAIEARRAGIRFITGYKGHSRACLLDKIIPPWRPDHPPPHHIDRYLRIAEKCGAAVEYGVAPDAALGARRRTLTHTAAGPPLVVLCPGAEYGGAKRWPADRFAAAALAVSQTLPCRWKITGLPREAPLGQRIADSLAEAGLDAENLCGKTTLAELITLLEQAAAVLTNDTGTMHLATLLGAPVVALFGPTEPAFSGPRGPRHIALRQRTPCGPCFLRECPLDHRCMTAITPEEAAGALLAILSRPE